MTDPKNQRCGYRGYDFINYGQSSSATEARHCKDSEFVRPFRTPSALGHGRSLFHRQRFLSGDGFHHGVWPHMEQSPHP